MVGDPAVVGGERYPHSSDHTTAALALASTPRGCDTSARSPDVMGAYLEAGWTIDPGGQWHPPPSSDPPTPRATRDPPACSSMRTMKVRLYVDIDIADPVDGAELDAWAHTVAAEFGERLRLDAPVHDYREGWEVLSVS